MRPTVARYPVIEMKTEEASPDEVADLIVTRVENASQHKLRQRVRQGLTWQAIFTHEILPLLDGSAIS